MAKQKSMQSISKNEKYLKQVFLILRRCENATLADRKTRFSNTEIRLIMQVLSAKYEGKRLISTQLAKLLGVTRSAISQIVNRLEKQGVVQRVADDVDRKIAYIEVTDEAMESYSEDLKNCSLFVGRVVEKFGEENFDKMCDLFEEFTNLIDLERGNAAKSRAGRKSKK